MRGWGEEELHKTFKKGATTYAVAGSAITGFTFMFGYFIPAGIMAAATVTVLGYGLSFAPTLKTVVSRVDYSHNTGEVRIFTNANNSDENYIQTTIKSIKPFAQAAAESNENKGFWKRVREHSERLSPNPIKVSKEFLPESDDGLHVIADAIVYYNKNGSWDWHTAAKMTQPIPIIIEDEKLGGKYATKPLFLGVAFNDFCYCEIDLLEKISEGDSAGIDEIYSASKQGFNKQNSGRKLGKDQM
jgi:hypothetical protein